ncbi:hypothetical protein LWI28_025497 [Acer negundo]|uniref:tRNA-uridine aminocarboxypropyltransferase n=1 Tax=Acer negundo TaxID=4023 RepID=A0AAD5J896_ACENE|nr:hypothetical protein LWI28_025497 [Acer negundo]
MLVNFGTRIRPATILNCLHNRRPKFAENLKMAATATEAKSKRPICPLCSKPTRLCLCNRFQNSALENSVSVTILQHSLECNHPLNSARIAKLGLKNVNVAIVSDVNFEARFDIRLIESSQESGLGGIELGTPEGDFENGDGFEIERRNVVGFEFKRFKKSTEEGNSSSIDGNEEENYSKDSNFVKKLDLSECDFLVSELENESISKECNGENLLQSGSRFNEEPVVTVSISKYGVIRDVTHFWVPPTDCEKPNFDQILGSEAALDALSKGFVVRKMQSGSTELEEYEEFELEVSPGSVLLFPSEEAVGVDGLEAMDFEVMNLIVLDGTWSKAKRMYKENPWLKLLPHLKLELDKMSLYSEVRTQPKAGYLSTIESIVYALKALGDNNTEGLNNLLDVFESMVGDQRRCKDERLSKIPPV